MDAAAFRELLVRARDGDQEAFAELVRDHGKSLRRFIRYRLEQRRLQSYMDSTDIYQSVLWLFAQGLREGRFRLETPEDAVRLMIVMAENRLTDHVRHLELESQQRQDVTPREMLDLPDRRVPEPSAEAIKRDLLFWIQQHLTDDEWQLYVRGKDHNWRELAPQYETTPDALRMRFVRILRKASRAVGDFFDQFPDNEATLRQTTHVPSFRRRY